MIGLLFLLLRGKTGGGLKTSDRPTVSNAQAKQAVAWNLMIGLLFLFLSEAKQVVAWKLLLRQSPDDRPPVSAAQSQNRWWLENSLLIGLLFLLLRQNRWLRNLSAPVFRAGFRAQVFFSNLLMLMLISIYWNGAMMRMIGGKNLLFKISKQKVTRRPIKCNDHNLFKIASQIVPPSFFGGELTWGLKMDFSSKG